MNIKQKIKFFIISMAMLMGPMVISITAPLSASAADGECTSTSTDCCGGVETSIITCTQTSPDNNTDITQNGVWGLLILTINILTAGIGIAAVGGIVYGSILYASAGGAADQVKKARGIITNVVIGIIAYALMYAVLNFLIPGGLF